MLQVNHLKKVFRDHQVETVALKDVNFQVNAGEFVSIMGESGSGKSTLLNIIATYEEASSGSVLLGGQDLTMISPRDLAQFRREELGFVFQDFALLDIFNNFDNIALPLVLSGVPTESIDNKVKSVGQFVGIEDFLDQYPYQVSGGQKQRIAIARSLVMSPQLILADEPTGALDSKTSQHILSLFQKLNQSGSTLLMVTHSIQAAARSNRVLFIKDGIIFHEIYRGSQTDQEFRESISESLAVLNGEGI